MTTISEVDQAPTYKLLQGDCIEQLRKLPDKSVHMALTSPPYHKQRFYDTEPVIWLHHQHSDECNHTAESSSSCENSINDKDHDWLEHKQKLHAGRGDSQKSVKYSQQQPIPDRLITTSICRRCRAFKGELGQEPTVELYIEHLIQVFKEVKRVLVDEGSLWMVIGDKYGPDKSLELVPEQFVTAMKKKGWLVRGKIVWYKPNRLPENVKDRLVLDHEFMYHFTKQKKSYFETQYEPYLTDPKELALYAAKGAGPRIGGTKAPGNVDNATYSGNAWDIGGGNNDDNNNGHAKGRIMRSVWDLEDDGEGEAPEVTSAIWAINTQGTCDPHFAPFPEKLCERPIMACCPLEICNNCGHVRKMEYELELEPTRPGNVTGTGKCGTADDPNAELHNSEWSTKRMKPKRIPKGLSDCGCKAGWHPGTVLDPFAGRGTSGIVALRLRRSFIGIDLNSSYVGVANKNLSTPHEKIKKKKKKKPISQGFKVEQGTLGEYFE